MENPASRDTAVRNLHRQLRGEDTSPRIEYSDPVKAAAAVLWRYRASVPSIPEYILRAIADAVLATADTICQVEELCVRQWWEREERYRDHVRQELRHKLLDGITRDGRIPTALPVETLGYRDIRRAWPTDGAPRWDGGVVPDEAVAGGADWTHRLVRLTVPVRTPPVDRAAAVRAGVL